MSLALRSLAFKEHEAHSTLISRGWPREKALFNKEIVFEEIVEAREINLMPAENFVFFSSI